MEWLLLKFLYSFLRYSSKKRTKRSAAGCTSAAKIASLFTKRRKTSPSGSLRCGALNVKNSQSLYAAPVRSEYYSQHRFARCSNFSVLTSEAYRKSGAFSEKRGAPQNLRRRCLAPLPKTWVIFSGRCADGGASFDSFLRAGAKKRIFRTSERNEYKKLLYHK